MPLEPSHAMARTGHSMTIVITEQARVMRAAGVHVISLSAGQPDFDTPKHIGDAATAAIRRGRTRYPPVAGIPELREAVSHKFARQNGLDYGRDETIVCTGGKQVIANALLATLNPGDEVVIPTPSWVSYPILTRYCGAVPVMVPGDPLNSHKLTPEALDRSISARTRWLILNSPNNPTGAVYSADELRALATVLERYPNVWVLSDDIYEHLTYEGVAFATMAAAAPAMRDRTLTMNGVSKAYAMTGWRIGYAGGPKSLIASMVKLQTQITSGACTIAQWAAVAALEGPQDFLEESRALFAKRRDLVVERLNAIPGMTCKAPEGAFYAYPDCSAYLDRQAPSGRRLTSDEDFVVELLETAKVATVHAAAFGGSGHFRVSFAASEAELTEGCDRIADFCNSLT